MQDCRSSIGLITSHSRQKESPGFKYELCWIKCVMKQSVLAVDVFLEGFLQDADFANIIFKMCMM